MTRRDLVTAMAAGTATSLFGRSPLFAAIGQGPLFAKTPLSDNAIARRFERVDMALPDIPIETAAGLSTLANVGGKTRLIALWAEWCVPCLVEIRDFASLRPQIATDRFDIGLLLTASVAKLDHAQAINRLRPLGAASLPLLVERAGGDRAAMRLASPYHAGPGATVSTPTFSLPCTLLVDARGRLKGRVFGAPVVGGALGTPAPTNEQTATLAKERSVVAMPHLMTQADKSNLIANGRTVWSTPAGLGFLKALGNGLLDRV